MTAPEIKQLAEDYLALPPGPYWFQNHVLFGEDEMVCIYEQGYRGIVEAEARRLNAMPGLLKAAVNEWTEELETLIARVEAHQQGEAG